jgi:hypothetical protein
VLPPAVGSATIEGRIDMGEKVIVNIRAFLDGQAARPGCCRRCCECSETRSIHRADRQTGV